MILAENERVVRTYDCLRSTGFGVDVRQRVIVTNRRVIKEETGNSAGSTASYGRKFPIESIAGFEQVNIRVLRIWWIFFGAMAATIGLGLAIYFVSSTVNTFPIFQFLLSLLPLVGGIVVCAIGIMPLPIICLSINVKHVTNDGIIMAGKSEGLKFNRLQGNRLVVNPQMLTMLHELPAIVMDIQSMGDKAVDKWSQEAKEK